MAERETQDVQAIRVKVIQDSGASLDAIVKDPTTMPWVVCEEGTSRQLRWQVVIGVEFDPAQLLFESEEAAKKWVKQHARANEYNWDALQEPDPSAAAIEVDHDALTRQYCKIAEENDPPVPPDSPEAFELAREDPAFEEFNSLVLYSGFGCTSRPPRLPFPVPSYRLVTPPWYPLSCRHRGLNVLYGFDNKIQRLQSSVLRCDPIPFGVTFAQSG
jgi:hypothetical protein